MIALFLLGAPGAGKTTLARALFERLDPLGSAFLVPSPEWTVSTGRYAAAGHYVGGAHDGADTVPYAGASEALDYWESHLDDWRPPVTLLDGDRFSHRGALERIGRSARPIAVLLEASPDLLAARRLGRGSSQNPSWMLGRETKARRFAELFGPGERLDLNASRAVEELVERTVAALFAKLGPG